MAKNLAPPKDMKAMLEILSKRGLGDIAIEAGWAPRSAYDKGIDAWVDGWTYPTHYSMDDKKSVLRFKLGENREGAAKYLWPVGKPSFAKYYMLAPFNIEDHLLYVAAGEPDLLTLHAAMPERNKLCWYGESSIPKSFPDDCTKMGITDVVYYRDHDDAGKKSAIALAKMFEIYNREHGADLQLHIRWNPNRNHGYDLNKLWIETEFDKDRFLAELVKYELDKESLSAGRKNATEKPPEPREGRSEREYMNRRYDVSRTDEMEQIKAIAAAEMATKLDRKPGAKEDYYICPLPHKENEPKDFILHVGTYPSDPPRLDGCQGKHRDAFDRHIVKWAEHVGVDVSEIARKVREDNLENNVPSSEAVITVDDVSIVSSDKALESYESWFFGDGLPDIEPFLCPYAPLRSLDGFARLWVPGRCVLIVGPSGMGKTALIERMADNLRADGMDSFMVGPEWRPEEYMMRGVARYQGPSFTAQWENMMYHIQKKRGISEPEGKPLNRPLLESARQAYDALSALPGKVHYVTNENITNVEQIVTKIGREADLLRMAGRRPAVIFWDYIQLARGGDDAWGLLEHDSAIIKEAALKYNLVPVIISQITKGAEKEIYDAGGMVSGVDGQGIGLQKFNLTLAISPVIRGGQRFEQAYMTVAKNSAGKTGKIQVKTALWRHDWTDEIIPDIEGE